MPFFCDSFIATDSNSAVNKNTALSLVNKAKTNSLRRSKSASVWNQYDDLYHWTAKPWHWMRCVIGCCCCTTTIGMQRKSRAIWMANQWIKIQFAPNQLNQCTLMMHFTFAQELPRTCTRCVRVCLCACFTWYRIIGIFIRCFDHSPQITSSNTESHRFGRKTWTTMATATSTHKKHMN